MQIRHFIDIDQLNLAELSHIYKRANYFFDNPYQQILAKKKLINLFFENSTRTRSAFEISAKNMGAEVININISTSALKKGESEQDTICTLNAMEPDFLTIRHAENGIVKQLSNYSKNAVVINSGDGSHAHPTQALLDGYTIFKHLKLAKLTDFKKLKIAICGDIINSRVARSNIKLYQMLGAKINLIAPPPLMPKTFATDNIKIFYDLVPGIKDVDVIITLRIQLERIKTCLISSLPDYYYKYGIKTELLKYTKPHCTILHPGPINRNVEIESSLADNSKVCLILDQVKNGIAVRQALLEFLA
ncbi:MAG: aspartate carbamoyltransferase catalytic subunit [Rickettsiales bacterium]